MLFTTTEQFIVLAVVLLGGALLGYACAPSPKKWKRRVAHHSHSFTAYYEASEAKRRSAERRVAELETQARAVRANEVDAARSLAADSAAPHEAAATRPTEDIASDEADVTEHRQPAQPPAALSEPAILQPTGAAPAPTDPSEPEMSSKGWLASSARDDLTRIRGIDAVLNTRLFGLGVVHFEDLEKLSAEDEMALEQRLTLPVGYIGREQWRTQAALLRSGKVEEHAGHFSEVEPTPVE